MAKAICIYYLFICCFFLCPSLAFLFWRLSQLNFYCILRIFHVSLLWCFCESLVFVMLLLLLFLLHHLAVHHRLSVSVLWCWGGCLSPRSPPCRFVVAKTLKSFQAEGREHWDHIRIDYLATPLCRAPLPLPLPGTIQAKWQETNMKHFHDVIQQWNKYVWKCV